MKRLLAFAQKEFRHILRDTRTLLILFGIPVIQIIIFGFVITNEIKNVPVVIIDHAHDETTRLITNRILASPWFELVTGGDDHIEIDQAFKQGNVRLALVFGRNFEQDLWNSGSADVQVIADGSDPNAARLMVSYITGILAQVQQDLNTGSGGATGMNIRTRMEFNPELKGAFMFVPGTIALILMLISAMMTSISIAREKEMGTMESMLVSPLHPMQIILGKVLPYVTIAFLDAILVLALGQVIFGVPVKGNILLLLAEVLLYLLLSLSLGIMISTFSPTQMVAMFMSLFVLMLPTILLSGFIYPVEDMPRALQLLSLIMPPRWFIVILKSIMLKGTGLAWVWKETLILVFMTLVFLGISIKRFSIRLEQN